MSDQITFSRHDISAIARSEMDAISADIHRSPAETVTVVMILENVAARLDIALESFYYQSYMPMEIVIVDASKGDDVEKWFQSFPVERYPFEISVSHNSVALVIKEVKSRRILFVRGNHICSYNSLYLHSRLYENVIGTGHKRILPPNIVDKIKPHDIMQLAYMVTDRSPENYEADLNLKLNDFSVSKSMCHVIFNADGSFIDNPAIQLQRLGMRLEHIGDCVTYLTGDVL